MRNGASVASATTAEHLPAVGNPKDNRTAYRAGKPANYERLRTRTIGRAGRQSIAGRLIDAGWRLVVSHVLTTASTGMPRARVASADHGMFDNRPRVSL